MNYEINAICTYFLVFLHSKSSMWYSFEANKGSKSRSQGVTKLDINMFAAKTVQIMQFSEVCTSGLLMSLCKLIY